MARRLDIWVMNADGTGMKNLTRAVWDDHTPAWSPDGRKIAYLRDVDGDQSGEYDIMTMNADGTGRRDLTNGRFYVVGLTGGLDWRPRPTPPR